MNTTPYGITEWQTKLKTLQIEASNYWYGVDRGEKLVPLWKQEESDSIAIFFEVPKLKRTKKDFFALDVFLNIGLSLTEDDNEQFNFYERIMGLIIQLNGLTKPYVNIGVAKFIYVQEENILWCTIPIEEMIS